MIWAEPHEPWSFMKADEDRDTQQRVTDLSKKFFVALSRRDVGNLRQVLAQACAVFQQKCIYLSIAGEVEFVEGPSHENK
jgi:hypothetical protein